MKKILILLLLAMTLNAITITQYLEAKQKNSAALNVYLSGMSSGIFVFNSLANVTMVCLPQDFAGFTSESVRQIVDIQLSKIKQVNKHFAPTDPIEIVFLIGLLEQFPCTLYEP